MNTIFDVLAKDHEEVRRMLAELTTGPTVAPAERRAERGRGRGTRRSSATRRPAGARW